MTRIGVCLVGQLFLFLTLQAAERPRVQVTEPFIEMHTGPGRGYPIVHVVERGRWVEILKRKTDWFKVRTLTGREGWADRAQMEKTLTVAGIETSFRDVLLDDFLRRRLEFGVAGGMFDSDPVVTLRAAYRLRDVLSVELSVSRVSGRFSSSLLYHANLISHPFPDWRISPYFTLGAGRFDNEPRRTLVDAVATNNP
ncbi:MAG: SH3 domain-containing protein, partial [Gammaproteobacteria bacterium]